MGETFIRKTATASDEVVMEAIKINKEFPGVKALTDVDITIRRGEVVALLGENGAGKSTLIKVMSGVYQADGGSLRLHGREVRFETPMEARMAGIGVIHQELNYVPSVSVAENIFMGNMPKRYGFLDYKTMYRRSEEILDLVGLKLDPKMPIGSCSVAQKQLIEIAKVISNQVQVLIMDEPTSSLNDVEIEYLFRLIQTAASKGVSIFYISHKLEELFKIADRVVVLRDGCVTGEVAIEDATRQRLIARMVGRDLSDMYPKEKAAAGEEVISVKNLSTASLKDLSFSARAGEIFGIYGLMGSGHQNVGSALFGQEALLGGSIFVKGNEVKIGMPIDAIACGIAYVPAERKAEGLVLNQSVAVNTMSAYYSRHRKRLISRRKDREISSKWIEALATKTPSLDTPAEALSGGNQQKVVLAKWLELSPDVLILNEPTRGIDVGAKAEIYRILNGLCREGKCIIMITSEMPELLAMSDRILILSEGKVTGMLTAEEATQEMIVQCAIGG
ncbi:MAG: sugar ABC transporter ATP-binding protein [Lachnospiraceae bacterium]|nr:sugar ABC transporter ATP-binding protein [Lachnospiraceae bacterium]